jgi:eukaryotic-like serine/threonine-protein kinase
MPADKLRARHTPPPGARPLGTRVWSVGRVLVLVAALAGTYGVFFLTAMRVANKAREVPVPNLVGQSTAEATATLAQAGLVVKVDPVRRADPKIPLDHVLDQDPSPGTVMRRQRAVRIRLSDGQRDPLIPAVVGDAERTAEIALAQDHIEIVWRTEIRTASYPADTVVAQDPLPKNRAARIALLVNRGEGGLTYVMPDLIGTQGLRVADILRGRGFRVAIVATVPYPGLPPGVVIRQTPQAGFQIAFGEPISIEVSQ